MEKLKETRTLHANSGEYAIQPGMVTLIHTAEYVERNNRILVGLIILDLIGALLSPIFCYWVSVSFSVVILAIGFYLGYISFKKVKEIRSV
mgnify:CR=1 FL=1